MDGIGMVQYRLTPEGEPRLTFEDFPFVVRVDNGVIDSVTGCWRLSSKANSRGPLTRESESSWTPLEQLRRMRIG